MLTQDYNRDEFSAAPKVIMSKPKYKDPYGKQDEYVPQNLMYDRRIVRGSTHAATIIPAGADSKMYQGGKRTQQSIAKLRHQAAEHYTRREIPTPEPLTGRQNLDVQTDQFVEELTDKAPCYDIGSQTEFKLEETVHDFSIPVKTGTDFCAQIEDGDLFIFDDEVEPILQVLWGKTLEHAKMEVLEEEELRFMREEQKHFQKMREDEIAEAQKLESIELRKKQEIERRKQQHKVKKLEKIAAHKKFSCRQLAKRFFAPLTSHAIVSLCERGALIEPLESKMYEVIVPWLYDKTQEFLIEDELHNVNNDKLLKDVMKVEEVIHRSKITKEEKRLENERIAAEKLHQQKLYEKEQRRLERERKKREEELRKLKEDIHEKFIKISEPVEGIPFQEVCTPNADYQSKNIIGVVGGPFIQMAVVLTILKQKEGEEYEEFFNKKNIAQFLITYAISQMKPDSFSILLDRHLELFMEESEQTIADITKLAGNKAKAFRDIMKDRENGMLNRYFRFVNTICEEVGINRSVFDMIHDVLSDVITRKPKGKEGAATKQDQFLERIKIVTIPEESRDVEPKLGAVVRIRIPFVEQKDDGDESEEGEEEGEEDGEPKKNKKEPKYVEAQIEDKVQLVNPKGADYNVLVVHQAGGRIFRKEIVLSLKKLFPVFEDIDADEIVVASEKIADQLEQKWISTLNLPVFDFEIN